MATEKNPNLMQFSSADIAALDKAGFENRIPDLVKLDNVGDGIRGEFVDKGEFEVIDTATGNPKMVPFYCFRNAAGKLFRVNGLTILDKGLAGVKPGQTVVIVKKPDVMTGNKRKVADFAIYVK